MPFLSRLIQQAKYYEVFDYTKPVLDNPKFSIWSGSSKPDQHHYGQGGLLQHTYEVVTLCMNNNNLLNYKIDKPRLFLAALYHDIGKIWDYKPIDTNLIEWTSAEHKYRIHHVSRSALVWNEEATKLGLADTFSQEFVDDITHAILSHHGLREWGSPVTPKTKLAWMLHLCDGISARMDDNGGYKN